MRIATRKSVLAICQAILVKKKIEHYYPYIDVFLIPMSSQGDRLSNVPLSKIGGKGLFIKELECALLENRADIAVHSMKDMPAELPDELEISAILKREDPRDVFVSNHYANLKSLPSGACVGTSSMRRQSQIKRYKSDLKIAFLRGNINTRIKRLDDGKFSGIILAAAGLIRLGLQDRMTEILNKDLFLPACSQGALGIESRKEDKVIRQLVAPLNDIDTVDCILAERAMAKELDASCQTPMACHAEIENSMLYLQGMVATPDASEVIEISVEGLRYEAKQIGVRGAEKLKELGAEAILSRLRD